MHCYVLALCVHLLKAAGLGLELPLQVAELAAGGTHEVCGYGGSQSLQLLHQPLLLAEQQLTHLNTHVHTTRIPGTLRA